MIGDYAWQFQPGGSFVGSIKVANLKFVVHFLLVGDHPWAGDEHP